MKTEQAEKDAEFIKNYMTKYTDKHEAVLKRWATSREGIIPIGVKLSDTQVDAIVAAGHPNTCSDEAKSKVYYQSTPFSLKQGERLSDEDVNALRLFDTFEMLLEEEGGYKEAGRVLKDKKHMEGWDAMFTYRFS